MLDNAGKLYVLNDSVEKADSMSLLDIPSDNVVYEVIRIIKKVPLFWEDHYSRLRDSLKLIGLETAYTQQEIKKQIQKLISQNELVNCNVKLVIYMRNGKQNLLLYISKSYYPGKDEIEQGVSVSLLQLEREKPNAKLVSSEYKDKVSRKIEEDKVFEVLLVNKDKKITEGSRSNVFFVKGKKVYTAPGEYVLKGITRQYIIDTCKRLGFEVIITLIGVEHLQDMDGLFISGTSIKVLPIAEVDNLQFKSSSNPTVIAIRDLFDHVIEENIKQNIE
ncbi:MAG: aminotransferase class IV [Clostridia bacterium]|nr:aminotransferase class IV [Clostridia bacterium]